MTDLEKAGANLLPTGLEDFEADDMAMPRFRIDHPNGVFVNSLSGEWHSKLDVVLLGLVKQRIMWPVEVTEEKAHPLCHSNDGVTGHPNVEQFPWAASGFDAPAVGTENVTLNCAECKLKDWGSHPKGSTPWCSEQYTFPFVSEVSPGVWAPAILTMQRSAIKPCKAYLTSFARSRTAIFTCVTTLTLDKRRRGTVNFAIPQFVKGPETDEADWPEFAERYRAMRDFLQTESGQSSEGGTDDDDDGPSGVVRPVSPSATEDDSDLPF